MDKLNRIKSVCVLNGGECDKCTVKDDCGMFMFRATAIIGYGVKPKDILYRDFENLKERLNRRVDNYF